MSERAFSALAQAVIAARVSRDRCFAARTQFWIDPFGDRDVITITTDDVDDGIDALVKRGKCKVVTRRQPDGRIASATLPTDQPLGNATVNRYIASLGDVPPQSVALRSRVRQSL